MNSDSQLQGFIPVCPITLLEEGRGRKFTCDGVEIALFKFDNNVYAYENRCPHLQAAIIHDCFIENDQMFCPAHGWQFNITDGRKPDGNKGLIRHQIFIKDSQVFVKIAHASFKL